jgi:quercetin dioxygenase-like cupin family protein
MNRTVLNAEMQSVHRPNRQEMTMKQSNASALAAIAALAVFAVTGLQTSAAQQTVSVKRNVLMKQDMTVPGREAVMALVELPPGSAEGRHTHPAEVYVFVQEGTITLEDEGKPTVTLKAGDYFYIAPGKVHQVLNASSATARLAAVFLTEKGKPLTTPAP